MKQTINLDQFRQAFHNMDRGNQFSYEALGLIFNHLEELDDTIELDVIAICCDFSEMTPAEIASSYNLELTDDGNELLNLADDLCDLTLVAGVTDSTIVFANF